jgi:hypothetical protein
MLHRALLLLLLLFSLAATAQAQYGRTAGQGSSAQPRSKNASQNPSKAACPWLTQGSAARALGGDVSVTASVSDAGEGFCRFLRQPTPDFLEVLISKASLPTCPPGSMELKGIGNQAESCNRPGARDESIKMITGRVRDLYFTVTLASRVQKSALKLSDVQEDMLEQIAEQVAGNLY